MIYIKRLQNCYCISFFFSSRRRHTRSYGDWSSDVCSSDLGTGGKPAMQPTEPIRLLIAEDEANLRSVISRSEERRVGKECRSRRSPDRLKKKKEKVLK